MASLITNNLLQDIPACHTVLDTVSSGVKKTLDTDFASIRFTACLLEPLSSA